VWINKINISEAHFVSRNIILRNKNKYCIPAKILYIVLTNFYSTCRASPPHMKESKKLARQSERARLTGPAQLIWTGPKILAQAFMQKEIFVWHVCTLYERPEFFSFSVFHTSWSATDKMWPVQGGASNSETMGRTRKFSGFPVGAPTSGRWKNLLIKHHVRTNHYVTWFSM